MGALWRTDGEKKRILLGAAGESAGTSVARTTKLLTPCEGRKHTLSVIHIKFTEPGNVTVGDGTRWIHRVSDGSRKCSTRSTWTELESKQQDRHE